MKSAVFLIAALLVFCSVCVDTEASEIRREATSFNPLDVREKRQAQSYNQYGVGCDCHCCNCCHGGGGHTVTGFACLLHCSCCGCC